MKGIKDPFDSLDRAMEKLDDAMDKMDGIFDMDFDSVKVSVDGVKGSVADTIQRVFTDRHSFDTDQRKRLLKSITDVGKSVKIKGIKGRTVSNHEFGPGVRKQSMTTRSKRQRKAGYNLMVFAIAGAILSIFVIFLFKTLTPEIPETPPALMETVPPTDGEEKTQETIEKL